MNLKFFKEHKKAADLILIAFFLVLSAALWLCFKLNTGEGSMAVVRVDGETVASYSLLVNGTYELNGGTNLLVIEDGYARIEEADCPDKICVRQGKIHLTGQCITCLPNRLTVTIEGGEAEFDIVVG